MSYSPKVNDYVVWNNGKGVEGWIYFADSEYITIEELVRPKDRTNYQACSIHRNDRLLVVCYKEQWCELKYVKTRESVYQEEENCVSVDC